MRLLFSISPSPSINLTRTLLLLSRAQVGFLNALLSGAAQSSQALSPFLVGLATKRSHRAVVGAPAAGGMRSNPRPHGSGTGGPRALSHTQPFAPSREQCPQGGAWQWGCGGSAGRGETGHRGGWGSVPSAAPCETELATAAAGGGVTRLRDRDTPR